MAPGEGLARAPVPGGRRNEWGSLAPELDEGYRLTFRRLTRIFGSRGFTSEEADEFAQEAIARTLIHLDKHGRRSADLNPLLNTIAKNLIVERFRTGGREIAVPPDERIACERPGPAEEVSRRDRASRVHRAMNELPAAQRRAMFMWVEGLRPAEIARELGIKRNAVDALLHRGRRQLATRLTDCRDAVWGAGATILVRLRWRLRRAVDWARIADPVAVVPALVGLAVVTAIGITSAETTVVDVRQRDGRVVHAPRSSSRDSIVNEIAGSAPRQVGATSGDRYTRPPDGVRYDLGDRRASVIVTPTNPATGDPAPLGIEIYRDPGSPGNEGITGGAVDRVIDSICAARPDLCEGG